RASHQLCRDVRRIRSFQMPRGACSVTQALGIAVFLLAVTGIGAVIQRCLRGDEEASGSQLPFGWSFLFGAAAVGLGLHIPWAIDGRITHLSFAAVTTVGLAAWGWILLAWWRWDEQWRPRGWINDLPAIAKIALAMALLPALVHAASSELSGYDARTIYG